MLLCVTLIRLIGCIILCVSLILYVNYCIERPIDYKNFLKIKFSNFIKWYYISPDEWKLKRFFVLKQKRYDCSSGTFLKSIECYFGVVDYYRYLRLKKVIKNENMEKAKNKQMEILLKSVQVDINDFRAEIENENEEAKENIEKIIKRLLKTR